MTFYTIIMVKLGGSCPRCPISCYESSDPPKVANPRKQWPPESSAPRKQKPKVRGPATFGILRCIYIYTNFDKSPLQFESNTLELFSNIFNTLGVYNYNQQLTSSHSLFRQQRQKNFQMHFSDLSQKWVRNWVHMCLLT